MGIYMLKFLCLNIIILYFGFVFLIFYNLVVLLFLVFNSYFLFVDGVIVFG